MTSYPYICLGCGKTFQGRQSLAAHTAHCYWYRVFRDQPEQSPFYREMKRRNRLRSRDRVRRYRQRRRGEYEY
jgi:hypothetical protein